MTTSADPNAWRLNRALARVEQIVDGIVAEHATTYWGLPYRRQGTSIGAMWRIDQQPVVEFRFAGDGPSTLVVYELSLVSELKKAIRSRHVTVREATGLEFGSA